jgi:hypothetical protein
MKRTPFEVAIGLVAAVIGSLAATTRDPDTLAVYQSFLLAASTTWVAIFATSVLHEMDVLESNQRWFVTFLYMLAGGLYQTFVLDPELGAELWRWCLLTTSLGFAAMLTPLASRSSVPNPRELTWRFTLRTLRRILLAGVYTLLLFATLYFAVVAFAHLLDIEVPDEAHAHLASWIFFGLGPWIFAAGLPEFVDRDSPISERTIGWVRQIGLWLVAPVLGLYMLLLYGYGLRLVLEGYAPRNMLSPLALGAAAIGLTAMFCVEPLRHTDEGRSLARVFEKFPLAYLPVVSMPAWAIWQRVSQHGWTEPRYVGMLATVGFGLCVVYAARRLLRRETYSATGMPAVFALLCLLGSFGPWGVTEVTKASQVAQLDWQLDHRPAPGECPPMPFDDPGPTACHPDERAEYITEHYGVDAFAPMLPEDAGPVATTDEACRALEIDCGSAHHIRLTLDRDGPAHLPTAGTLYRVDFHAHSDTSDWTDVELDRDGTRATLHHGDNTWRVDLGHTIPEELPEREHIDEPLTREEATVPLTAADGAARGYLVIDNVEFMRVGDRGWTIEEVFGHLLVEG